MKPITIKFTISQEEIKSCTLREGSGYTSVTGGAEQLLTNAVESLRTRLTAMAEGHARRKLNGLLDSPGGHKLILETMTEALTETLQPRKQPKKSKPAKKAA